MILIISTAIDTTTNQVAEWLVGANAPFQRLSMDRITSLSQFISSKKDDYLLLNGINSNSINIIWHRRGRLRHVPKELNNIGSIYDYLKKEEESLLKSTEHLLYKNTTYIGSYEKEIENFKTDHLILARKSGMKIPDTLITTEKKELLTFFNTHKAIITKDIRYPINITFEKTTITSGKTFIVTKDMINSMNVSFSPVLVQEKIEKLYEIRIFFFKDKLYTMAIFSQNDKQTQIDYRNYNETKPNRCVPVIIPDRVKRNIKKFIAESSLHTGSIDMIYSENEEYVFLEINPMGQLDWLSKNCNYYIEKEIADYLIKIDNEHKE